jgi:DNA-binding NarL/FixJ family response regulator
VGKTSVWLAAIDMARERGLCVLTARPVESETSFGFAALGDLLRDSIGDARQLPERQARALEVALLLTGDDAEPVHRQAVALATLGVLRLLARRGPLVVALDDAQWLDAPSAAALQFAARRLDDAPVGLLVTARGAVVPLGLESTFARDGRLAMLALAPLQADATRRLLATRLALALPRPTLARLYEQSGGNPFAALELGRAYRAGTLRLEPGEPLPPTLDRLVRDRLEALSPPARRAVLVAAATSRPTVALLGDDPEALAEATSAGILELHGKRIRFTHPLLASAAYAGADADERRTLHARLSRLVADQEERARHLALAAPGPDERVAATLEAAARGAQTRGAPAAAASLYQWSARLTPGPAPRRRVDAAYCLFEAGDSRTARASLERIAGELEPGPERARALIRLARVRSYDDDLGAAEDLFRSAIAEAGADAQLRATAQEGVAATLFRRRERLDDAARHAAAAASNAADPGFRAEALGSLLLIESVLGRAGAAETLAATLALQDASEHRRVLAQPLFQAGCVWLWRDELDRAGAAFERLRRSAAEIGDESSLPYVLVMLAQVECVRGAPAVAAAHADAGRELAEHAGQATLGAYLDALRALADAIAGDVEHARARAERALAVARRTSGRPADQFGAAALGLLELSLGRAEAATEILAPRVEFVRTQGIAEPGAARFVADHVEALIALGDTGAEDLLRWYEGNARRLGRRSALAAATRCHALLCSGDAAVELLDEAVTLSAPALPLERARTLLARGAAHRRARHKRLARESLAAALALFEQVGARRWAERAHAELARIGGRAPARGALTETERRVAELVAEGLATKQVAAALFVSPKTVEGHLTSIYTKLGIHSRAQLARRLVQTQGEFPVSRVDAAP